MSWDGKSFDRPLIMLDFDTPQKAISKNAYEPDDDVEALITNNMTSEQLILVLREKNMLKEACDFIAHCVNRRVGVWWAYSCVEAINKEVEEENKKNPLTFEEKVKKEVKGKIAGWTDKTEIEALKKQYNGKIDKFKQNLNRLDGPEIKDPDDPLKELQELLKNKNSDKHLENANHEFANFLSSVDPGQLHIAQRILDKAYANYEAKHGINPMEEIRQKVRKAILPEKIPEDSTIRDQVYGKVEERIKDIRQYIQSTMNKHFPLKIPGLPKTKRSKSKIDAALYAVKRWILTPTDENGKIALDSHKAAFQQPEGLCALAAYWSCANLTPGEKTQLVSPPGLYSSGIKNTIFMCAMKKGGSKKYEERYEEYFNIGIDCISGVKTWDKEWKNKPAKVASDGNSNNLNASYGFGR
ncbi:hypothetical protein P0136_11660 [Lentisphaerota bacterium ZTH]|nr:hypothetical protein JYG24_10825 [Lentisphaerota bacterium]WET06013.1 hypothetical protein P0136_11660 [Lentisphaerota bacterium ZTH]